MMQILKQISAFFHIRQKDVCELSKYAGLHDYHDYYDSVTGQPWHFFVMKCRYCGKAFVM